MVRYILYHVPAVELPILIAVSPIVVFLGPGGTGVCYPESPEAILSRGGGAFGPSGG